MALSIIMTVCDFELFSSFPLTFDSSLFPRQLLKTKSQGREIQLVLFYVETQRKIFLLMFMFYKYQFIYTVPLASLSNSIYIDTVVRTR